MHLGVTHPNAFQETLQLAQHQRGIFLARLRQELWKSCTVKRSDYGTDTAVMLPFALGQQPSQLPRSKARRDAQEQFAGAAAASPLPAARTAKLPAASTGAPLPSETPSTPVCTHTTTAVTGLFD